MYFNARALILFCQSEMTNLIAPTQVTKCASSRRCLSAKLSPKEYGDEMTPDVKRHRRQLPASYARCNGSECVVTGLGTCTLRHAYWSREAGFLDSHLCERLLANWWECHMRRQFLHRREAQYRSSA